MCSCLFSQSPFARNPNNNHGERQPTARRPPSSTTMSSTENLPVLALSDIMHPMSPSPVSAEEQLTAPEDEFRPNYDRDALQEPLTDSEVLNMRSRLQELGLIVAYDAEHQDMMLPQVCVTNDVSSRERELTDMILRLTNYPRIEPGQLEEQAAAISRLATQRDLLIAQAEEERLKLRLEREGWDRTAEALLTQKTRPLKSEDVDAQRSAYEAEIKTLRDKLHDRHRRLSALEQEILRLKPLLLMQPYPTSRVKKTMVSQTQTTKVQDKGKRREVDSTPVKAAPHLQTIQEETTESPQNFDSSSYPSGSQHKTEASLPARPPSNSHPFLFEGQAANIPASQRRRSKDHSTPHKKKLKQQRAAPISSDAYTEHVLLAAQRIGRKRAALVTGLQKLADREKELLMREQEQIQSKKELEKMERDRLERLASGASGKAYYRPPTDSSPQRASIPRPGSATSTMKTPKRGSYPSFGVGANNNANPGGVNTPPPSTYVFVNTSATSVAKTSMSYSPGAVLNTPNLGSPVNRTPSMRSTHTSNTPTPLDSLVDAARMLGENGDRTSMRRRSLEEPESPTAKRRRISMDKQLLNRGISRFGREKSGLDVLADQAAAVNKPNQGNDKQSDSHSLGVGGKGKGKAKLCDNQAAEASTSLRSSTRTLRASSRRHVAETTHSVPSAMTRRGSRRLRPVVPDPEPEPRVIALPVKASSTFESADVAHTGLRPVVGWGERPDPEDDEEDDEEDFDSESPSRSPLGRSSLRGGPLKTHSAGDVNGLKGYPSSLPSVVLDGETFIGRTESPKVMENSQNLAHTAVNGYDGQRGSRRCEGPATPSGLPGGSRDAPFAAPEESNIRRTPFTSILEPRAPLSVEQPSSMRPLPEEARDTTMGPSTHPQDGVDVVDDASAHTNEDEDAEGEDEDEENESEVELVHRHRPSRSRSPPPPDSPGYDNGPGDEQDPDADAEGEMDFGDRDTPPSGTTSATTHQAQSSRRHTSTESRNVTPFPYCYSMPPTFLFNAVCLFASCWPVLSSAQSRTRADAVGSNVGNLPVRFIPTNLRKWKQEDSSTQKVVLSVIQQLSTTALKLSYDEVSLTTLTTEGVGHH